MCLLSDALLQHLPSYLGFSDLGHGESLHGCSSKVQPLLLTLDEGYLLITTLPDLQCGIVPLGSPAPAQPPLPGCGVGSPGCRPWPLVWGSSSEPPPLTLDEGYLLTTTPSDLEHGIAPLDLPALEQPLLLGGGVGPPSHRPWP